MEIKSLIMQFFTSSEDLEKWVKVQESSDSASQRILKVIGNENQQDIIDACRSIFDKKESLESAKVLYKILAKYNIVENIREGNNMEKVNYPHQFVGLLRSRNASPKVTS